MLTALVGIDIVIESMEGKWKLIQNRSDANKQAVIQGLIE